MLDQAPPERDALDGRVERALRVLTEPSGSLSVEDVLLRGRATTGRAGWRAAVAVAASIVLAVGLLGSVRVLRDAAQAPSMTAGPASSSGSLATASAGPYPTAESLPATRLGGVEGLKADLRAAGASVEQVRTYGGAAMPFRGLGVELCVDGLRVDVWLYDSPQERAADTALIDPDDPRHVGSAIAEWRGRVTFWERDRIIVLDLGGAPATTRLLGSVLGEPLAQDPPGDPGPFDQGC